MEIMHADDQATYDTTAATVICRSSLPQREEKHLSDTGA
jgi:hypothetical protein